MDKNAWTKRRRWLLSSSLLTMPFMLVPLGDIAHAMPGDGTVVAGQANINTITPTHMQVLQGSNTAIINWNSFSIGNGETVQFVQPGAHAIAVNRVLGDNPSNIFGSLIANGQIMLINPNGVLFGPNSRVDVGGLIATTIDIDNEKILSGDFTFDIAGNPAAAIVNQGTISAADGGLVALVAPGVSNTGIIQARLGKVTLAGANKFSVDLYGDGLVSIPVTEDLANAIYDAQGNPLTATVSNSGTIKADGGQVVLTARTAKSLVDDAVNMSGVIEARSAHMKDGVIVLDGGAGTTRVSGTINASGKEAGEKGGRVKITGDHVAIDNGARIDASGDAGGGTVHIGGEYMGGGTTPRAKNTTVASDTLVDVSAITNGDGGEAIIWSDEKTSFAGTILAKGGADGGHGGFVETSGKETLTVRAGARVDASAQNGDSGQWLLDPRDVYLVSGAGDDVSAGGIYNPTIDDASVDIATINMALTGGTSVTITTNDVGGGQPGNITLVDALNATPTGGATLTLLADNNIILNAGISTAGMLNLVMTAGGNIVQNAGTVASGGGNITLSAVDMIINGGFNAGAGSIFVNGGAGGTIALGAGAGNLNLSSAELAVMNGALLKIGNAASGAITIGADITPGATALHLHTGGAITGTAGGIIATDLALQAGGTINITDASTNVTNLAVSAAGQNVTFADASGLNIGSVAGVIGASADTLNFNTVGALTDSAAIAATTLNVTSTGAVTLDTATNNVTNLGINAGANAVTYVDASGFNVTGLTGTTVTLTGAGALTDSGTINATTLNVTNNNTVTFDSAGNDVVNLNINAGANTVTYIDSNALNIAGLTAGTAHITSGTLTDSGVIAATNLNVTATGNVTLDSAANDVTNLSVSAAGHNVTFADATGLNLAGITANSLSVTAGGAVTDSVAMQIADVSVASTGAITLDEGANDFNNLTISATGQTVAVTDTNGINLSGINAGNFALNAGGAVTDSGAVVANTLNVTSTGDVTLDFASNDVDNLIVSAIGRAVTFRDVDGLNLAGILANSLSVTAGGAVTDTVAMQIADINMSSTGSITLDEAANDFNNVTVSATGQTVSITDANAINLAGITAGTMNVTAGGAVTDSLGIAATSLNVSANGAVTLDHAANDVVNLSVAAGVNDIIFNDASGLNLAGITGNNFTLTAGGAVTDSAATIVSDLDITANGAVTLDFAGNDAATIDINAGANAITFADATGIIIDGLTGSGATLIALGSITDNGIINTPTLNVTAGGAVTIDNLANSINVFSANAAGQTVTYIDVNGIDLAGVAANNFILNAGGPVTDSGNTIVNTLNVTAAGDVMLNSAGNNAGSININAGVNNVTYVDTSGFDIAGLVASSATLTGGGAITDSAPMQIATMSVSSTGSITLDEAANDFDNLTIAATGQNVSITDADGINLAGVSAGTFALNAGGAVTDTGAIVAGTLNVTATGDITLDFASNDVDNLIISAVGRALTFRDADGLNLAGIIADTLMLTTGGAITDSAATVLTGDATINAGPSAVTLDFATNDFNGLSLTSGTGTIVDVDDITLNVSTLSGALNVQANNGVTVAGNVSANGVNINADQDTNGTGDLTVNGGATLSSNNNAMNLTANDVAIAGATNSGTNTTTLIVSDNGTIDIGNGGGAAMNISAAEIAAMNGNLLKIGNASSGAITISSDVTPGASALHLHTGSTITGTAGGIIVTGLALQAGGAVTMTDANTDVTNLAISAPGQNVTFVDSNGFNIDSINGVAGITGSSIVLTGAGAITDNAAIIGADLTVNNTAGPTTLDFATNDVDNLTVNGAGQAVTFRDTDGINLAGITASSFTLQAGGLVSDSVAMQIADVSVTSTGAITLDEAANDFDNLVVSAGGQTVTIVDVDDINLNGITAGTLTLNANGAVTDSNATIATNLNITTTGAVTLDVATNDVDNLFVSAAGQNVTFHDADNLNLAGITADTLSLQTGGAVTDSLATVVTNLGINAGGIVTLDAAGTDADTIAINAGSNNITYVDIDGFDVGTVGSVIGLTGGTMSLNAGAAVTQSNAITGTNLGVTATGAVTLTHASNNVTGLGISAAGQTVSYRDANALNIDNVGGANGINAGSFDLVVGGALTDNAATIVSGHTNITAGGNAVTLDVAANDFNTVNIVSAGNARIDDANGIEFTNISGTGTLAVNAVNGITLSGNSVSNGATTFNADSNNDGTGNFTLNAARSITTSNDAVTISAGDLILDGTINTGTAVTAVQATGGNTIDLGSGGSGAFNITQAELDNIDADIIRVGGAASGALTVSSNISAANAHTLHLQSGSTITATAGAIIEDNLAITAGGTVTMTNAAMDVNNLAISATNQAVTFVDVDGINIGAINGVTGVAVGTGSGTFRLTAGGAITQGSAISGHTLGVDSTGPITLAHASNNFVNVAFFSPNAVSYRDTNAFNIGTLGSVAGVTASALTLQTNNNTISDSHSISVSGALQITAGTGTVTLDHINNYYDSVQVVSAGTTTLHNMNPHNITGSNTTGNTRFTSTIGINVNGNISSTGTITLDADSDNNGSGFVTNTTHSISTGVSNQEIILIGAGMTLEGGTINSGTARTSLEASVSGTNISLGGIAEDFSLTQAELDTITAGSIRVRTLGLGFIHVSQDIVATNTDTFHFMSGGGIIAALGAVDVQNLALETTGAGTVSFNNANNNVDNLAISMGSGGARYTSLSNVNFANVAGINGLNSIGPIIITAAGITDSAASTVTNFAFGSTGAVVLDSTNNFGTIAGSAAGQDVTIVDSNALVIGSVSNGVTYNGIIAGNLNITVGGTLTDSQASTITGNTSITAGANAVTLDHANNDFNTLNIVSAGNTLIRDLNAVSVGTSNVGGTLAINTNDGITISGNVTTTNTATFDADLDNNGSGVFTVNPGQAVNTTNTALNVIAHDVVLDGNLNSGSADTTISPSSGQTIGIGDTAQTMSISKAELARITAQNLNIGGTTAGNITVDNVAAADLANVADRLNIDARSNQANIYFSNNSSSFKTVFATADDSIFVDQDLSSTVGQISLTADYDGAPDPLGDQVYVASGVNITAAADAIFESATGITIGTNVTVLGPLVINADTDNDGIGSLTILGGITILTNNNDLSMIAADYFINGTINAGTGRVSIETTAGRTMGIGDALGDARIDKTELARITAGQLYIGGVNTGNIRVDNVTTTDLAGIAGNVTFAALFNGAGVFFDNADSSFTNSLTITSENGVTLDANVTAGGLVTIDSDINNDGDGDFALTATHTLNSTGNNIDITANDMTINGTMNAGAATTTLLVSDNGTIGLGGAGGNMNLTAAELANITAGTLRIGDMAGGAITVSADTLFTTVDTLLLRSAGAVTASAGGIVVNNLGVNAGGAVTFTDASTDVDNLAINTTTGAITFNDLDGVTVTTVAGVTGLATGAGNITLRATDMELLQAVNAGAGTVTLEGAAAGTIGLGGAGGDLNLTAAELARVTANTLHIGTAAAGAITLSDDVALSTVNRLELQSAGAVTGTAGGVVVGDLAIAAGGTVTFTDTTTDVNTLNVNAAGQAITFYDADDISVALTGATADIRANNGITVTADFTGTGASSFNADADNNGSGTFTANAGVDIAVGNNTLDITARDLVIDPTATLSSGSAITTILVSNGGTISLGGAGGNMAITDAELDRITAGTLRIGDATAGAITLAGDISPSGTTTLHLRTGGAITGTAGGVVVANLAMTAGGTINITDATSDVTNIAVAAPGQNVTFRDATGLNIGTVDGVTGINAATFTLNAGGAVTDSEAITVTTLDITSTGAVTLDAAGTDVDHFAVSATGQTVSLTDIDDVNLTGINAGTFTLNAGGAVTDSGNVIAGTLNVTTSTGGVTLNSAGNDADNLNINAAGQSVVFTDTDGFNINALTGQGVQLSAGGAMTQSGGITADTLAISGTGSVTLNHAANDVNALSVNATGQTVAFTDTDGIDLNGITAGTFTLNAGGAVTDSAAVTAGAFNVTANGPITFDFATSDVDSLYLSATGQTVSFTDADGFDITGMVAATANLTANGAVTDSGTITVNDFNITGTGSITLDSAANDVDNLYISATGQTVTFVDADGINLNGITAGTVNVQAGGAVTDTAAITAGAFNLTATGPVTLDFATTDVDNLSINAGVQTVNFTDADGFNITGLTAGNATLNAGGAITDTGTIAAGTLNLTTTTGGITLNTAGNDVDNLFVAANGQAVIFVDADGINLNGITAQSFTLNAGGAVTDTDAIIADTLNVTTTGPITLDMVTSDVNDLNFTAIGQVASFTDVDGVNLTGINAGTFTLNAGGAVTDSGNVIAGTLNVTTSTGGVTLNSAGNDADNLNINAAGQSVVFTDTDGFNINALTGQGVQLSAGGAMTQSGGITADTLAISGTGSITLNHAANDVNALSVNATGQTVAFTDADGIDLNGITAGTFTLNAGGAVTDSAAVTAGTLNVTTSAGGVVLDHTASDVDNLSINAAAQTASFRDTDGVNLTGVTAGAFTLNAGGAVTDSGAIIAGTLNVATTTGGIVLDTTTNDVDSLTLSAAGQTVTFRDADGVDIAGVTAGTFTLNAGGAITDTGTITATTMNVTTTSGGIVLNSAGNDVDNLSATATGQTVTFVDADGINLTGVTATTFNLTTGGAITDSGSANVISGTTTLNAGAGNNITLDTTANNFGTVAITAANNVLLRDTNTFTLNASTISGTLEIRNNNGLIIAGNVSTGGAVILNADNDNNSSGTLTINAGATLNTNNNTLTATARDMAINGALNSGTAMTTLLVSNGGTISLGGAGGNLALTNAELNAITASTLRIGDNTAGNVTVVADIAPAGTNTLHLRTGGSITGTAGGITETNLAMSAGTGITLTDTTTNIGTLAATTTAGSINIDDNGTLTVGIVDGVTGISAAAGNVTLQATDMDIQQAINSGAGIVTLLGDTGNTISLGGAGGALALTNAELNAITAGTLRIGDNTAGNITVVADIAPAGTNTLHLRTGGSITGTVGGITETNVALSAGTGITLTDTTTNIGTLAATSTTGAVTVHDTGLLTIGTVDGVTGITATGGDLTLTAGDYDIQQAINNTGRITSLLTTPGNTISLGGAGGGMALSNAELDAITASILRIGDNTAGNITIVSDIAPAGTNTLHLRTGGSITGTAGGITETNLALSAGGTININDATTDIDTLAIAAPGQTVTFRDIDDVTFGTVDGITGISASSFNLQTGGAIINNGPIIMDTFSIVAGGNVTLDHALNDVNNLSIIATGFDVIFNDVDDINILGLSGNNVTLTAGGAVTDSGTITAGTLNVTTSADGVTLDSAANDVDNLNINAAGQAITFVDTDGFNVVALNGAATHLTAGGTITQSGAIAATALNVTTTAGGFVLTHAGNDVNTLNVSSAGQTGSFTDANGVDLTGVNAGSFTLNAGGAVTDSGAITAGTLNVTTSAGGVTLDHAGNDVDNLGIIATGQNATFVDLDGVNITGATADSLTMTAGGAVTDTGAITVGTLDVSTSAGGVTLDHTGNDVDNLAIAAAGQAVTFTDTDGFNINSLNGAATALSAGGPITQTGALNATSLSITANGGVTLNNVNNDVDSLAVTAPGYVVVFTDQDNIDLAGINAGSLAINANGAVTDSAANIVAGTTAITAGAGNNITLDAANDFGSVAIGSGNNVIINDINAVTLATSTITGDLNVTSASGITQSGNVSVGGNATFDADVDNNGTGDFTINGGQTLAVTGPLLNITANDFVLNGAINHAGGTTTLLVSDNGTISLGGAGGDAALSNAEMNAITTNLLRIGDAAGGAITIAGNIAPASVNTLHLRSGGAVTGTAGAVDVDNLAVSAGGPVTLNNAGNDITNVAISAPGQAVSFRDANAAHVTSVDGVAGITGTSATLQTGGALSADAAINAPTLSVTSGGAVTLDSVTNNVDVLSVSAPGQTVTFLDAGGINLGGVTANNFTLTTSGAVIDTGAIIVPGVATINAGAGNDVTLDEATNDFGTVAIGSGRHVVLRDANGMVIGASTISGTLDAGANNGITIDGAVTTAGATVIDADLDNNGSGAFTVNGGGSLNTANNTLGITAHDVAVNGALSSGTAAMTMAASTPGRTWGLGNAGGDITLSGAELQNITAGSLSVGGADAGTITVDGVSAAHTANINNMILNALGNNSQVRFVNNASTFRALAANADAGIDALTNITTTTGDMNLDGDADNADDAGSDAITYGPGVLLNAAGNLNLSATTGGGIMTGGLTLQSANGNVTLDSLNGAHNLGIHAPGNITITDSIGGNTPLNNVLFTGGHATGDIHANVMTVDMDSAIMTGTIAGQGGEDAAALIILNKKLPGPYTMNGFLVEGYVPPPPPPAPAALFDPSTQMPIIETPWRSVEGRIQTMGDLLHQDPMRTPYIPDILTMDDTFFTYTRDLMLSIFEGSVTDLRMIRIVDESGRLHDYNIEGENTDSDDEDDEEDEEIEQSDEEIGFLIAPKSFVLVAHGH